MPLPFLAFAGSAQAAALEPARAAGDCLIAGKDGLAWEGCPSWEAFAQGLPQGCQPAFVLAALPAPALPAWLFEAPLPVVAVCGPSLPWGLAVRVLPRCGLSFHAAPVPAQPAGACPAAEMP